MSFLTLIFHLWWCISTLQHVLEQRRGFSQHDFFQNKFKNVLHSANFWLEQHNIKYWARLFCKRYLFPKIVLFEDLLWIYTLLLSKKTLLLPNVERGAIETRDFTSQWPQVIQYWQNGCTSQPSPSNILHFLGNKMHSLYFYISKIKQISVWHHA